jgi:hypothetical protein
MPRKDEILENKVKKLKEWCFGEGGSNAVIFLSSKVYILEQTYYSLLQVPNIIRAFIFLLEILAGRAQ